MARSSRRLALLTALVALTAAACSRPSWTDPETSKASRAPPRPTAPPGVAASTGPGPPLPAWVIPLMGKPAVEMFPNPGSCIGNTDALETRFLGGSGASRVVGWAWDTVAKAPVTRIILVDEGGRIVGGGESGSERPDVPVAKPVVTSSKVGWSAITPRTSGRVGAHGVVGQGRALCSLAGADL